MSAGDWEEVKRLAADFQRAQLSTSALRLSERNCVEVITKLIELKLLEVIFTTDGKEYLTPQQLVKEIKDELFVHGGRINLVELSKVLNVDLAQITAKANEIERAESACQLVLGQLIDKNYVKHIAEEINERLAQQGQVSIADLTRQYDLPSDFLQSVVEKNLGKVIHAKQDKQDARMFFTDAFVARNKAVVRGALVAATRPTPVTAIINQCGISERTFFSVIDSLLESKEVAGTLTGRQGTAATFIPHVYSKAQSQWATNFYKQNGYIEYSALHRLGISDAMSFVKRQFSGEKLVLLPSCAVGRQLLDQVEGSLDEAVSSLSWFDVMSVLPSVFEVEDGEEILKEVVKNMKSNVQTHTFCSTFVVTDHFLQTLVKPINEKLIDKKAEEAVSSGKYQQSRLERQGGGGGGREPEVDHKAERREERRKRAVGGKGGGGTQGRETKTKSTKKKYGKSRVEAASDSEEEEQATPGKLELLSLSEVIQVLKRDESLQDEELENFVTEIAKFLLPDLNKKALVAAEAVFENLVTNRGSSRRKTTTELQEKLNVSVNDVRLYDKGVRQFPSKDVQAQLTKHLLKTTASEVVNTLFTFAAQDSNNPGDSKDKELTVEERVKILSECPTDMKDPLQKVHKSLAGSSVEDFLEAVDPAFSAVGLLLRKADKKKDRPQLLAHRHALADQLTICDDPALVLHLAVLLIFQAVTGCMLQASGRFVSTILQFLGSHLSQEVNDKLQKYHDSVLKLLKVGDDNEERNQILKILQEDMQSVKDIALNYKKNDSISKQA
ncbi:E3 UFM1-protein ligase 1 homolog [Macrosteles quadrilineatus]|uniref:E3 UFM1-protein ligase 1 homolog n=1 Tax=Macrosteles quadrilineatus TaxID=74068 RepID=UPI0023E29D5D|nr:E3 UFM1-protein ligase 1 homolog [Macrosteles quadrilineatus]